MLFAKEQLADKLLKQPSGSSRNATTLVEIMVATTILSFALAPVLALFLFASRSSGTSSSRVQAQFLAHAVLESLKAKAVRDPEQIRFLPSRFSISPTREISYSFSRFRVRNALDVFDHVHGFNKPITPDSELYEQFERFTIMVELIGSSVNGAYNANIEVTWKFEGKAQKVSMSGVLENVPQKFVRWKRR